MPFTGTSSATDVVALGLIGVVVEVNANPHSGRIGGSIGTAGPLRPDGLVMGTSTGCRIVPKVPSPSDEWRTRAGFPVPAGTIEARRREVSTPATSSMLKRPASSWLRAMADDDAAWAQPSRYGG